MAKTVGPNGRVCFSTLPFEVPYPDLLDLQFSSSKQLFEIGSVGIGSKHKSKLYKIFEEHFPISDVKETFLLEFLGYTILPPCYTPEECLMRGITYEAPLRVKLRLTCNDEQNPSVVESEVYVVSLPCMTPRGSYIIKGVERVVVSQLQRSPGIFYSKTRHATGAILCAAKIIPEVGSWFEFAIDSHNVMYTYVDHRRKKILITWVLRYLGYGSDRDILVFFDLADEVKVDRETLMQHKGRLLAERVLKIWEEFSTDEETDELIATSRCEVIVERKTPLGDTIIEKLLATDQQRVMLLKEGINDHPFSFIFNTLEKDVTNSAKDAQESIYKELKGTLPGDDQVAQDLVDQVIFGTKGMRLGQIGRHCLNKKLGLRSTAQDFLTKEDVLGIIKAFPDAISGQMLLEDLDSLSNRIVQRSGDQFEQVLKRGIKGVAHQIRSYLSTHSERDLSPEEVVDGYPITSLLHAFLSLDPSSQYMKQANPLSEVVHKRSVTKLSKALSGDRAGLKMRSVHPSYKNRVCPIETPEGAKVGLIAHFAVLAVVDAEGFVRAAYRKVHKGKISQKVSYLTAEEESGKTIGEYFPQLDDKGAAGSTLVARDSKGEYFQTTLADVDYVDLRGDQGFAISTGLIPFKENTEGSRVAMGANMLGQALPLLKAETPIVGTGMEWRVAKDARVLIEAEEDGVVTYVDAEKIVIKRTVPVLYEGLLPETAQKTYHLVRLRPSNQNVCIRQTPIVKQGQVVKRGDFLCEGYGVTEGELALGCNLRVAFMPWDGYNFEDSIVISERVVREDKLTSLHVTQFTVDLYNTKLGPEEFTDDIPGISEEATKHLKEDGVIQLGKKVKEGDILVGKITPQSNENPSAESKLMAAIFGNMAGNVRDSSLRVPPACEGTVVKTEILSKRGLDRKKLRELLDSLREQTKHAMDALKKHTVTKLMSLLQGASLQAVHTVEGQALWAAGVVPNVADVADRLFLGADVAIERLEKDVPHVFASYDWTTDATKNQQIGFLYDYYRESYLDALNAYRCQKQKLETGDVLPPGVLKQAKIYVAQKCAIEVGDKLSGRHGNKGVVSKIVPEESMPYLADGTRIDIIMNSLSIISRMNTGQIKEALLGAAGAKKGIEYAMPIFEGMGIEAINQELADVGIPPYGRVTVYDGYSGEPFHQKVTVGHIFVLKLNHLVRNKIHARATGPCALITQQPVGGRARKGGQRLGEMEVWCLEAYGAAYTLQEMLTIKSDDVEGRRALQDSIYKGYNVSRPGMPEMVRVVREYLAALCINLDFIQ